MKAVNVSFRICVRWILFVWKLVAHSKVESRSSERVFFQRNQGIAQCCIIVENTSIMFYKKHKWKNIFHQSTNFWKNNEKFNMNVAFILQEYNFLSQILNWRDIKSWVVVIFEKEEKRLQGWECYFRSYAAIQAYQNKLLNITKQS